MAVKNSSGEGWFGLDSYRGGAYYLGAPMFRGSLDTLAAVAAELSQARAEALQVAAMAVRFIEDVIDADRRQTPHS